MKTTIEDRAAQLAESWINGNRAWVMAQIATRRSRAASIRLLIDVAETLREYGNTDEESRDFLRAARNHYFAEG